MASSGKKTKKSKGKTLALNDFLQETPSSVPTLIRKSTTNWADEVEDSYDSYDGGRQSKTSNLVLPTAPKAARGIDDFSDKIPQIPPFNAYLSNLPYDVEESEIAEFFGDLKISNMRIPKEDKAGEGSRVKGFGYVEFQDQESLIAALEIPSCVLKGRRIRIEVATSSESDRKRSGRMDMNRDRPDRPDVFGSDWRTAPRKEPEQPERRPQGGGGFSRGEDRGGFNREGGGFSREGGGFTRGEGGGGFTRGEGGDRGDRGGFTRDRGEGGGGFSRDREGGGGFNREREPGSDKPGAWRDGNDRPSYRDNDRYNDDNKDKGPMSRDGPRGGDRYGGDRSRDGERRGGFGVRNRDDNNRDRNGGYSRGPRDREEPRERESDNGEPRARPKLQLAPRTKTETDVEEPLPPKPVVPAASIFGNAKPVDTTARERQIEDRLAKLGTEPERESRRDTENRRRDDKPVRRASPDRKRYSPPRRSPEQRREQSPEHQRESPDQKKNSPDRNRGPAPTTRKYADDKRGPPRNDKPVVNTKNEKERTKPAPREHADREMPKLKEAEPLNIVATNQYSFLAEGDSD